MSAVSPLWLTNTHVSSRKTGASRSYGVQGKCKGMQGPLYQRGVPATCDLFNKCETPI